MTESNDSSFMQCQISFLMNWAFSAHFLYGNCLTSCLRLFDVRIIGGHFAIYVVLFSSNSLKPEMSKFTWKDLLMLCVRRMSTATHNYIKKNGLCRLDFCFDSLILILLFKFYFHSKVYFHSNLFSRYLEMWIQKKSPKPLKILVKWLKLCRYTNLK